MITYARQRSCCPYQNESCLSVSHAAGAARSAGHRTRTHTHTHTHTHIHTYTHIHTRAHAHTHAQSVWAYLAADSDYSQCDWAPTFLQAVPHALDLVGEADGVVEGEVEVTVGEGEDLVPGRRGQSVRAPEVTRHLQAMTGTRQPRHFVVSPNVTGHLHMNQRMAMADTSSQL